MSDQIEWDFVGDDDAKAQIGAAVMYLLKDCGRKHARRHCSGDH